MDSSLVATVATVIGAAAGAVAAAFIGRRGAQEANKITSEANQIAALETYTANMRSDLEELREQRHEDVRRLENTERLLNTAYAWMRTVTSMASTGGWDIPPLPDEVVNHLVQ